MRTCLAFTFLIALIALVITGLYSKACKDTSLISPKIAYVGPN